MTTDDPGSNHQALASAERGWTFSHIDVHGVVGGLTVTLAASASEEDARVFAVAYLSEVYGVTVSPTDLRVLYFSQTVSDLTA